MTSRVKIALFLAMGLLPQVMLAQEGALREEITVQRLIIDAHVIDDRNEPIRDLRPSQLSVEIDGQSAVVETVEWIPAEEERTRSMAYDESEEMSAPHGRLIVLFFQTDFQRFRVIGQMKMVQHAREMIGRLGKDDLVAVVTFDSQLRLRQDFTRDRKKINKAIEESLRIEHRMTEPSDGPIALLDNLDLEKARRAATPERALVLLGESLAAISGAKSLVMFGWGLGHYVGGVAVFMDHDYDDALRALDAARTTVFVLDITDADNHTLEVGLMKTAEDTGGMYIKTDKFARRGMEQVEKAISGRYEIVVRARLNPGRHDVDVKLRGRRGTVLARRSYLTD